MNVIQKASLGTLLFLASIAILVMGSPNPVLLGVGSALLLVGGIAVGLAGVELASYPSATKSMVIFAGVTALVWVPVVVVLGVLLWIFTTAKRRQSRREAKYVNSL